MAMAMGGMGMGMGGMGMGMGMGMPIPAAQAPVALSMFAAAPLAPQPPVHPPPSQQRSQHHKQEEKPQQGMFIFPSSSTSASSNSVAEGGAASSTAAGSSNGRVGTSVSGATAAARNRPADRRQAMNRQRDVEPASANGRPASNGSILARLGGFGGPGRPGGRGSDNDNDGNHKSIMERLGTAASKSSNSKQAAATAETVAKLEARRQRFGAGRAAAGKTTTGVPLCPPPSAVPADTTGASQGKSVRPQTVSASEERQLRLKRAKERQDRLRRQQNATMGRVSAPPVATAANKQAKADTTQIPARVNSRKRKLPASSASEATAVAAQSQPIRASTRTAPLTKKADFKILTFKELMAQKKARLQEQTEHEPATVSAPAPVAPAPASAPAVELESDAEKGSASFSAGGDNEADAAEDIDGDDDDDWEQQMASMQNVLDDDDL